MDWNEAIEYAKDELGYDLSEYVEDWDEVVETAKTILEENREEEREEYREEYYNYLRSKEWKIKRQHVLIRDKYICQDCGETATQVQHITYANLHTKYEENDCIYLCENCHKLRHGFRT